MSFIKEKTTLKSDLKKIKDCKMRLSVEVAPEWVESRFQDVLKEFQKAARLPGFREGKAPTDLIEKKFAEEAREEVLKSLIPEAYHQSIQTHHLTPVSLPSISDIQFERGKKLTFTAEFEEAPEIAIKNYKGIRLKRAAADVSAEDVEKAMGSLLDSRADLIPVTEAREVRPGDYVLTDIEIWQQDKYIPGKKGILLFVEPGAEDDFYEKIVGAKIDEVREVAHRLSDAEKAQGIVGGGKPHYKVWVRGIKEKKVPAMDEEFAKSFGKESIEDLKAAVRRDIASYKQSESIEKMKVELFEKLLGMTSFTLPEGLVEKQKTRLIEQTDKQRLKMGIPDERFEKDRAAIEAEADSKAKDQVKLYFIIKKVAEFESIDADEIELEKRLTAMAEEGKRPLDEVRHTFGEDLRESMVEKKTIDFLIANAKFDETATSEKS